MKRPFLCRSTTRAENIMRDTSGNLEGQAAKSYLSSRWGVVVTWQQAFWVNGRGNCKPMRISATTTLEDRNSSTMAVGLIIPTLALSGEHRPPALCQRV